MSVNEPSADRPRMPDLLRAHVDAFNRGARSGDFSEMTEGFTDDAEMTFQGVPVGPFVGRDAIARAYRDQPPTTSSRSSTGRSRANADPGVPAGRMTITPNAGRIGRLVVTFDPPGAA